MRTKQKKRETRKRDKKDSICKVALYRASGPANVGCAGGPAEAEPLADAIKRSVFSEAEEEQKENMACSLYQP